MQRQWSFGAAAVAVMGAVLSNPAGAAPGIEVTQDPETGWSRYVLSNGRLQVELVPEAGFNVGSLKVDGTEMLRHPDSIEKLRGVAYGVPILYPTPNRVRDAAFTFQGREYRFPANNGPNFIHGLVHSVAWDVVETSIREDRQGGQAGHTVSVTGGLSFQPQNDLFQRFPFPHTLRVTVSVTAEAVRWTYEVDNRQGTEPIPFGFALHPYFQYLGSREHTYVEIPASHVMEAVDLLPTGKLLPLDDHPLDARQPTSLAQIQADDVYYGLDPDRPTRIGFRDAGYELALHTSRDFTHLVLYSPDRPFFCVENQTCSTDAHNLAASSHQDVAHLMVCPPGEIRQGWVEYRPEKTNR